MTSWSLVFTLFLATLFYCYGNEVDLRKKGHLSGTWYNQMGSEMTLNHSRDGTLFGIYRTAVERRLGSAGGEQAVHGRAGIGHPTTFGFTVTFNSGKSTAAWSGQYQLCDDEEVLLTTWVLTAHSPNCKDYWKSTTLGQDRFTRWPQQPDEPNSTKDKQKANKVRKSRQEEENMTP